MAEITEETATTINDAVTVKKYPSTTGGVIFIHSYTYDNMVPTDAITYTLQDANSGFIAVKEQTAQESFTVKIPFSSLTPDPIENIKIIKYTIYLHKHSIITGTTTKVYNLYNTGFYQYINID